MKQGAESESMTNKYTLLLVSAPLPLHVAVGRHWSKLLEVMFRMVDVD